MLNIMPSMRNFGRFFTDACSYDAVKNGVSNFFADTKTYYSSIVLGIGAIELLNQIVNENIGYGDDLTVIGGGVGIIIFVGTIMYQNIEFSVADILKLCNVTLTNTVLINQLHASITESGYNQRITLPLTSAGLALISNSLATHLREEEPPTTLSLIP